MTANTMSNLQASIFKFMNDFCESESNFTFVNFDAHANEQTAPPGDLAGPAGFAFDIDENLVEVQVLFGVATESDTNLFRLSAVMGRLVELVKPAKRIRVIDADDGTDLGWMVVTGKVKVLPVGGSQAKPLQYVMLKLTSNLAYQMPTP